MHLTEWPEFRELSPADLRSVVETPVVVDARLKLDADAWRTAGWTYRAPGRPNPSRNPRGQPALPGESVGPAAAK